MNPLFRAAAVAVGTALCLACTSMHTADHGVPGVTREHGGIVVSGPGLVDGPGDLLGTMMGKVPNFRVRRVRDQCPQITLRNAVSFQSVVNPHVYIDGARSTDTCILDALRAHDVQRVEVYPTGVTTRPGYGRHAHGLILVFMRDGLPDSRT
jgi:hypothetical protein